MPVIFAFLIMFALGFLCILASAGIIYIVWNFLVVTAFSAQAITYFQAIVAALVLGVIGSFFRRSSK